MEVGSVFVAIGSKIASLKTGITEAQGKINALGKTITDNAAIVRGFGAAFTAMGAVMVGALGFASSVAIDYNESLANLQTMVGNNAERMEEWKEEIQKLSVEMGKSTDDLTEGAYQVVSAFGDGADSMDILAISARAATAGAATTTEAINLLSAVTKGYGDTSKEAVQKTADLAFQTVKLGQTTFPELAKAIGRVVPLAKSLDVSQEELFTTMATATGVTGNAAEVSTQFRGALQALLAPSADMTDLLEGMGFASGKAMLQQKGFLGTMSLIKQAADQTGKPLQKYIGSIEGQTLALALTESQQDVFLEKQGKMQKAAGAMGGAFEAQTAGINEAGFSISQLQTQAVVLAQTIGDVLMPVITPLVQTITDIVGKIVEWAKEHPALTSGITVVAGIVGTLMLALGPMLLALPAIVAAVGTISTVLGAIGAVALGPIALAIAGIVAAVYLIVTNWDLVSAAIKTAWEDIIGPTIDFMIKGFGFVWDKVKDVAGWIWGKLSVVFTNIINSFMPVIDLFIYGFGQIWPVVQKVFSWIWDKVSGVIMGMYNSFRWVLKKLGVELPSLGNIFETIGDAGESAAGGIATAWNGLKESFKKNMEENKKVTDEATKDMEETEKEHIKYELGNLDTLTSKTEKKKETAKQKEKRLEKEHLDDLEKKYGAHWSKKELLHFEQLELAGASWKDYAETLDKDIFATIEGKYSGMLTEQEEAQATMIKNIGGDWQKYADVTFQGHVDDMEEYFGDSVEANEAANLAKLKLMGLDWQGYAISIGAHPASSINAPMKSMSSTYGRFITTSQIETAKKLQEMGLDWETYADNAVAEGGPINRIGKTISDYFSEGGLISTASSGMIDDIATKFSNSIVEGDIKGAFGSFKTAFDNMGDNLKTGLTQRIGDAIKDFTEQKMESIAGSIKTFFVNAFTGEAGFTSTLKSAFGDVLGPEGGEGGFLTRMKNGLASVFGTAKGEGGTGFLGLLNSNLSSIITNIGIAAGVFAIGEQVLKEKPELIYGHAEAEWEASAAATGRVKKFGTAKQALINIIKNEQLDEISFLIALELWKDINESTRSQFQRYQGAMGKWSRQLNSGSWPSGRGSSPDAFSSDFHKGGILPYSGVFSGLAGEGVLSLKGMQSLGGNAVLGALNKGQSIANNIVVNITGNTISSEMDLRNISRKVSDDILSKLQRTGTRLTY